MNLFDIIKFIIMLQMSNKMGICGVVDNCRVLEQSDGRGGEASAVLWLRSWPKADCII